MLKQLLQRLRTAMTKTIEEPTVDKLSHVQSGGVQKESKKPRVKQGKYAMLLGYQGKKYYGMQVGIPENGLILTF